MAFHRRHQHNDHDYAPVEEGELPRRDTHLRLEGPAAAELEYFFFRFVEAGRARAPPLDESRYAHSGRRPDPKVKVITNDLRRGRLGIREEYRGGDRLGEQARIWHHQRLLPAR